MQLFVGPEPLDFPDSANRRPVESGFWGFGLFVLVYFSLSSNMLLYTLHEALGLFVSLLSNAIMTLIKTDWFLEKARADRDREAEHLGGL